MEKEKTNHNPKQTTSRVNHGVMVWPGTAANLAGTMAFIDLTASRSKGSLQVQYIG